MEDLKVLMRSVRTGFEPFCGRLKKIVKYDEIYDILLKMASSKIEEFFGFTTFLLLLVVTICQVMPPAAEKTEIALPGMFRIPWKTPHKLVKVSIDWSFER